MKNVELAADGKEDHTLEIQGRRSKLDDYGKGYCMNIEHTGASRIKISCHLFVIYVISSKNNNCKLDYDF